MWSLAENSQASPTKMIKIPPSVRTAMPSIWATISRRAEIPKASLKWAEAGTELSANLREPARRGLHQGSGLSGPQPDCRPSSNARAFEAGAGAETAEPTERRHHRGDHAVNRLAAAFGAGVLCGRGTQEARAEAGVGK